MQMHFEFLLSQHRHSWPPQWRAGVRFLPRFIIRCLAPVIVLSACVDDLPQIPFEQLLMNPSFENQALGWDFPHGHSTTSETAHTGRSSAKYVAQESLYGINQTVAIIAKVQYTLSAWMSTQNLTGLAFIQIDFMDATGKILEGQVLGEPLTGSNPFTYFKGTVLSPANATHLLIKLFSQNGTGVAYFDDVKLFADSIVEPPSPTPKNFVKNGGFEEEKAHWQNIDAAAALDSIAWYGSRSIKINASEKPAFIYQDIAINSQKSYQLLGFIKTSLNAGDARLKILWYKEDTLLTESEAVQRWFTGFTRHEIIATPPKDAEKARIQCQTSIGKGEAWFDEISFVEQNQQ